MLKTFPRGGIHPAENKISAGDPITPLPVPDTITIPVAQHIGAPSSPVVKKGDQVKAGDVIAASQGFVSTNIHAPVSGMVLKIDHLPDTSGYKRKSVVIRREGDEWNEQIDRSNDLVEEIKLSREDIVQRALSSGIVGLGGATFPSHVKLSVPRGNKARYLIINGVECEPYLTSDHRLMLEKGPELMVGIRIIMKALGAEKTLIGIEKNKPDAIEHLSQLSAGRQNIEVVPLKVKYPQGGEKQLIKALTGREVPSGGLPINVDTVVHNVGTAFAIYEAVQKNKPLIERVVTITGLSVEKPGNYWVRLGTPVRKIIEAAGGLPGDTGKVVAGGPMMGKALNTLDVPIVKGTSGILVIREQDAPRNPMEPCIRCSKCISVCPMGLEPYLLMSLAEREMWEREEQERIMDCIECGSCSYTCPAYRPLLDYIRLGKTEVSRIIRARKNA